MDDTGPGELRFAGCIEHAPVRTDAAFKGLPRLIERLDDVVVDTECIGAGDEVAQHLRLRYAIRGRLAAIVAGARPAELRDHDALARVDAAEPVIECQRQVDRALGGMA